MFDRILLAVDGSEHSHRAVAATAELAATGKTEVLVLHLQELGVAGRAGPIPLEERSEAADLVNTVADELRSAGVTVHGAAHAVLTRDVAPEIISSAKDFDAGLIVMGTRGMSDFAALLIGSVAHKVIHHAHGPLLVTREPARPRALPEGHGGRDPRHDVLFEPVRIGPVTARNRFFQVPHCTGMGYRDPSAEASLRQVKAEGGWAVVCTEQVEIHPTSDITPFIELRIWDDSDLPALEHIAARIHDGGALAGIELAHNGMNSPNLTTREPPIGPVNLPVATWGHDPVQARAMTKSDIASLRGWHREAVLRSLAVGYDLVYVYAGHALSGLHYFLSSRYNSRTDEYGGSVRNRARLLSEILADAREAAAGRAGLTCRLPVN